MHHIEEAARKNGREVVAEYETAFANGTDAKLHRVAHRFLTRGSLLRAQFELWATSDVSMKDLPHLRCTLRDYAMIPVVCRRVESVHSWIKI